MTRYLANAQILQAPSIPFTLAITLSRFVARLISRAVSRWGLSLTLLVGALLYAATPTPALGDTVHTLAISAGGSEFDAAATADYHLRHDSGWEFGLSAGTGWLRQGFIAGYAVEDGSLSQAELTVARSLYQRQGLRMMIHASPGARLVRGASGSMLAPSDSTAITLDTGLIAHVNAASGVSMHAGILLPLSYEIAPEIINDVNGGLLTIGAAVALGDRVEGFAAVETGGIFGADGDAGKYLTRATAGVRMRLNSAARIDDEQHKTSSSVAAAAARTTSNAQAKAAVGPFVTMGWRVLGLANHVSHGPSMQAGAVLWGRLKLGLAVFQRPGPINPKTFAVDLPQGMSYRGQSTIDFRSDGAAFGVMAAPILAVPKLPLRIEIPVMVGMAGFGFYLHGDDRETPDGRRVSEWEDTLLQGRDSNFSLVVDAGIRAALTTSDGWWQPYIGAHYTATPGYEATLEDDYSGFSVTGGIQIGRL